MREDMDTNGGEVSDAMSDNEYDEANLQLLRDEDNDTDMDKPSEAKSVKTDASVDGTVVEVKKKYDPKDPLRPRRKKARRACYACQRAHLTCGDERPCQRCIKRGLADGCQDGVRKKAKYLHDAPAEALRPVLGPNFNAGTTTSTTTTPTRPNGHRHPSSAGSDVSASNVGSSYYAQSNATATSYGVFSSAPSGRGSLDTMAFPNPQSPVSPTFASQGESNPLRNLGLTTTAGGLAGFSPALFDPSNPALFNFNLEGINFGSQYAAMEFGMLGHMSSGAADDPTDPTTLSQQGSGLGFGSADVFVNGANQTLYDGTGPGGTGLMNDFIGLDSSTNGFYSQGNLQHGLPHAYAIAAAPPSMQSPSTDNSPQPTNYSFEGSPTTAAYGVPGSVANGNTTVGSGRGAGGVSQHQQQQHQQHQQLQQKNRSTVSKLLPQSILGKRHRDPSAVYEMVKEPYMYVHGFHRLIALLQRRYSANKILRIAKALSSIRPSFISCTRTLNRQDLVFMEKCFQRTLFEYEEFMMQASSPAIVCRRTGEVAAVNKEFTALTGWTKEVLLGKAPNLNVNMGTSATAAASGADGQNNTAGGTGNVSGTTSNNNTGRAGLATPRLRALNAEVLKAAEGKPQPMFIAELMDDDNVIEFYEDFAQLAFGDSRGSVTRKCRLLKYRTRDLLSAGVTSTTGSVADEPLGKGGEATAATTGSRPPPAPQTSILSNRVARIDGEHGISKIERDGKLECSYCWHIRRDTFDIPMMIVMNFLPCYYPNQEPQAV